MMDHPSHPFAGASGREGMYEERRKGGREESMDCLKVPPS